MRGKYMILAVISLTGLLAASPAWAGCNLRDLAGAYQEYSNWVYTGVAGWTRCTIVIRNNGTVKPNTTCRDSDGFVYIVTGGSFSVTSSCNVTGEITTTDVTSVIDHAWFDLSRNIITGVGHDVGEGTYTFTSVRK